MKIVQEKHHIMLKALIKLYGYERILQLLLHDGFDLRAQGDPPQVDWRYIKALVGQLEEPHASSGGREERKRAKASRQ
jgi:hypothetical protein